MDLNLSKPGITTMQEGPKQTIMWRGGTNKINHAAGKAHPNILKLVELFKTENANTYKL